MRVRRCAALVLGCVLSATALLSAPAHAGADPATPPDPGVLASALDTDPVHLDPRSTMRLTPDQEQTLRSDVAAAPDALYVVALGRLPAGRSTRQLAAAVARRLPDPAWLVVYADTLPAFGGSYADDDLADRFVLAVDAGDDAQGSPATRLLTITGQLSGRLPPAEPAFGGSLADPPPSGPPSTRVSTARVAVAALAVLLLLGLVATVVWLLVRRVAAGHRTRLLGRRVARGRQEDRAAAARRDVLDLGSSLDEVEMGADDDRTQWQAALDSYDHASRLLDRAEGTHDYEQVVSLCQEGRAHLAGARAGHA